MIDRSYYKPAWDMVWMSGTKDSNFIRIIIETNRMCDRVDALLSRSPKV